MPELTAAAVLGELERSGVTHIVWLPDSETGFMYQAMIRSSFTVVPVCREGESFAIAAGLIMGGKKPAVLIQSTGFFESGDSIRGMCLDLHLPLLLMLGYRGYFGPGKPSNDSAARMLEPMLKTWGIPFHILHSDADAPLISEALGQAERESQPVAVLIGQEYHA